MCGIVGKVVFGSGKKVTVSEINLMSEKIAHRGPDDCGVYLSPDQRIGLGHRRLAIIDLSSKGHQPMIYQGRFIIVYNGEVYNFQELRRKLQKDGFRFRSKTDTEVILALYAKYGVGCLSYLRGFFAFAIYDRQKKILFLARDRIGKKPLKYFYNHNFFCFASELKALLRQKEIVARPDMIAINYYLTLGYLPVPYTGFEDIYKLEPGHYLMVDLTNGKLIKKQYWQPNLTEKIKLSKDQWKEKFLAVFEEAVKLRMIADVPVGAFLSGGVDSSAVVAMMAKHSIKPVKTFSIGLREKKYDERKYAKRVAKIYGTDHTELIVEPEAIEMLPKLVYMYEEPYCDASAVITYLVSKIARKYVKVVLNGDGGDENFVGYDRFVRLRRDAYLDNYKSWLSPLGLGLTKILGYSSDPNRYKKAEIFFKKLKEDFAFKMISYNSYFGNQDKEKLFSYWFSSLTKYEDSLDIARKSFQESGTKNLCDQALLFDLTNYLPEDLLVKVDIASMSVGLEARSPFLDTEVVDLASKIPFSLKLSLKGETKYILKKSLEGIVPQENLYRKKMGFSLPLDKWFTGSLGKYAKSVILSKKALKRGLFDPKFIRMMFSSHSLQNDFGPKLWCLLTLELWFEEFFD